MAKTGFIFLLLLAASSFVSTAANSCSWANFYCSYSSQCVSSQWRCDGDNDCPNGEDERACRTACPDRRSRFRCNNYRCIARTFVCDDDNDCGDNSDEVGSLCGSRTTPAALQCYSCSSSSSSCSATTTCSSGQRYCYRKTYDITFAGSTSRVTNAGCRSSCTSSDRTSACRNKRNCQITCCSTSSCNSDSSGGSSSNPSCYTCVSTSSYQECENKAILTRCSSTTSYCYKMDYKLSSSSDREGSIYKKGCIADASSCSQLRSNYLSSILIDECNVYCCTGSGCNAGSVQQFSVVILMTCAVVFFISQNLFFLPLDTQL